MMHHVMTLHACLGHTSFNRLWKAVHDCIDMSQEENHNITPLLWLEITELDDDQVSKFYSASS